MRSSLQHSSHHVDTSARSSTRARIMNKQKSKALHVCLRTLAPLSTLYCGIVPLKLDLLQYKRSFEVNQFHIGVSARTSSPSYITLRMADDLLLHHDRLCGLLKGRSLIRCQRTSLKVRHSGLKSVASLLSLFYYSLFLLRTWAVNLHSLIKQAQQAGSTNN